MATQKNNPMGNDYTPPAAAFGSSPVPEPLVPPETIPETGAGPTLLGWNQSNPASTTWSFGQDGYAGTYTED